MKRPWLVGILALCSVIILGRAVLELGLPYDCDEKALYGAAAPPSFQASFFDFTLQSAHAIATFAAMTSARLGAPPRLPAIFFTALLLAVLALLAYRRLWGATGALLFLSFLTNEPLAWYFHSARGYAPMLFLAMASYAIVWTGITRPRDAKTDARLFYATAILSALNHFFSLLFFSLFCLAVPVWRRLHAETLSPDQLAACRRFTRMALFVAPFYAAIAIVGVCRMTQQPDAFFAATWSLPDRILLFSNAVMPAFGVFRSFWRLLLLALIAVIVALGRKAMRKDPSFSYPWIPLALGFVVLTGFGAFVRPPAFPGRLFLVFPPLIIIAMAETLRMVPGRALRTALLGLLALVFIVAPALESHPAQVTNMCGEIRYVPLFKRLIAP